MVFGHSKVLEPLGLTSLRPEQSEAKGGFSRDFLSSQVQNPGLDLKDPQHVEFILHGDRMAWTWIRQNPGAFASLAGKKWALVSEAWMLGWTQFDWPGASSPTSALALGVLYNRED
jgi:hypothetical protein